MHTAPVEPEWIAALPRDTRDFPVPAEAPWHEGSPIISKLDTPRKFLLGAHNACAICGMPLASGGNVYRAFSQADAATIRTYQRDAAQESGGPSHLSCMLYATYACPYLANSGGRLGRDTAYTPGERRGTLAAVMGFKGYKLLVPATPKPEVHPQFLYEELVEDLRYKKPQDLVELYDQALSADQDRMPANARPLYWGPEVEEKTLLAQMDRVLSRLAKGSKWPIQVLADPYFAMPALQGAK